MENNRPDKPQPLFGDHDIRHSVETVSERWEREMSRRRRLAAKIVIPLAIILVGGWLFTAKKYEYFPFQRAYEMALPPRPEEDEASEAAKTPIEKMGNAEAKLRFSILVPESEGKLPEKVLAIFHEATDTKPSQIYAEIWEEKMAPQWLKELMSTKEKYTIAINESPIFQPMDKEENIIRYINDSYSNIYKDDNLVINPSTYGLRQPTEEELKLRSEKRIQREKEANLTLPSLKFER